MQWYERFLIGFVSALLYPSIKATQNGLQIGSAEAFAGVVLPFAFIGILIGLYAMLVEGNETDRGKLFRMCLALPAFIIGLASSPIENSARAESKEVQCDRISDFQRGLYDAIAAITGVKRPRYYLLSRNQETSEYLVLKGQRYFILGRFDRMPEGDLVYDVDKCQFAN